MIEIPATILLVVLHRLAKRIPLLRQAKQRGDFG